MRATAAVLAIAVATLAQPAPTVTTWRLDNLREIGGVAVQMIGAPAVVSTAIGSAIQFNGVSDGLLLERNPLEGLSQFTVEVLFAVDAEGPVEQRFFHAQELEGGNRALIELRLNDRRWALDSYLRHGDAQLTLLDPSKTHDADRWHVASTTFDGTTLKHFVDGVEQGSGTVAFRVLGRGRTSIGVRQNRVSWFKGRIHTIRISPKVLTVAQLLRAPARVIALWPEGVPGRKVDGSSEQIVDGRVVNVHEPSLVY